MARETRAFGGWRIASADRDARLEIRCAQALGGLANADQRCAQVAFHVDRERFDGRNVKHPAVVVGGYRRLEHQPVDAPQKCSQRFAGAGGSEDQGGFASRDGRPAQALRPGGFGEDRFEPVADGGMKQLQPVAFGLALGFGF